MNNEIQLKVIYPDASLSSFVESYWMIVNLSDARHEIIILPDGRFDIIFCCSPAIPFSAMQMGLGDRPEQNAIPAKVTMFAVSFKLLAIEYLWHIKAADLLNGAHALPDGFWGITKDDMNDFESFCKKAAAKMRTLIKPDIDNRKQALFEMIYSSGGALPVREISQKVFWSSRQINRYFQEQFGISLKAYCNILRFKASLSHIKDGRLFPEGNFADQNHFIKEVKKFSGVVPKALSKNENGRFILLSALPGK